VKKFVFAREEFRQLVELFDPLAPVLGDNEFESWPVGVEAGFARERVWSPPEEEHHAYVETISGSQRGQRTIGGFGSVGSGVTVSGAFRMSDRFAFGLQLRESVAQSGEFLSVLLGHAEESIDGPSQLSDLLHGRQAHGNRRWTEGRTEGHRVVLRRVSDRGQGTFWTERMLVWKPDRRLLPSRRWWVRSRAWRRPSRERKNAATGSV